MPKHDLETGSLSADQMASLWKIFGKVILPA